MTGDYYFLGRMEPEDEGNLPPCISSVFYPLERGGKKRPTVGRRKNLL